MTLQAKPQGDIAPVRAKTGMNLAEDEDVATALPMTSIPAAVNVDAQEHDLASASSPLTEARAGERLCVRSVAGSPTFLRRMMDLGLRAGISIEIVNKTPAGVVVRMDGMRMAISPAAGRHIFVAPCPGRVRR